ncbi:unnamed protein product [Sphagnum jensenii]|uniref:Uncharacterized protein n=1 Tax=Sphagnum jensenii TaxID=128206 RepID=A0ABP0WT62_9BRYO
MDQNLLDALCQNNLSITMPTKVTGVQNGLLLPCCCSGEKNNLASDMEDRQLGCCSSQPKKYNNQCHCLHTISLTESYASQNQAAYDMVNCPEKHA